MFTRAVCRSSVRRRAGVYYCRVAGLTQWLAGVVGGTVNIGLRMIRLRNWQLERFGHTGLMKYEGQWKHGKRDGEGVLWVVEGPKMRKAYIGLWQDDERNGKGTTAACPACDWARFTSCISEFRPDLTLVFRRCRRGALCGGIVLCDPQCRGRALRDGILPCGRVLPGAVAEE